MLLDEAYVSLTSKEATATRSPHAGNACAGFPSLQSRVNADGSAHRRLAGCRLGRPSGHRTC
jgi:hypothetical protein